VFPHKEKVGRPKSRPQQLSQYIEATEVIYESETPITYEMDDEQVCTQR
jgi:hypothetical protein